MTTPRKLPRNTSLLDFGVLLWRVCYSKTSEAVLLEIPEYNPGHVNKYIYVGQAVTENVWRETNTKVRFILSFIIYSITVIILYKLVRFGMLMC